MGPFERRVNLLLERVEQIPLNAAFVDKLEKDYRLLLRNFPRVTSQNVDRLDMAIRRFADYVQNILTNAGSNETLKDMFSVLKRKHPEYIGWLDTWDKDIRTDVWSFYIALRDGVKLDPLDNRRMRDRTNRVARKCFETLRSFAQWCELKLGNPAAVSMSHDETTEIAGYKVVLRGMNDGDPYHGKYLKVVTAGLEIARRRIHEMCPALEKYELPVIIRFDSTGSKAGEFYYHERKPEVMIAAYVPNGPQEVVRILAHEFTHYLYDFIHPKKQQFWEQTIAYKRKPLDFERLLKVWPENVKFYSAARPTIAMVDPEIAVAADVLYYDVRNTNIDFGDRDDAVRLSKGEPITVPQHAISWYAEKNAEEAFCEAVSHWITYGPRRIPPVVLAAVQYVLGVD